MKKLLAFVSLTLISSPLFAWEYPENPDRYPSIALGYSQGSYSGSGDGSLVLFGDSGGFAFGATETNNELDTYSFIPSARLPLSNNLTLDLFANFGSQDFKIDGNGIDVDGELKGKTFGGNLRFYLK